jgi:hypothetical protein
MNPQAGALDSITGMTTTQAAVTPGQVSTETIPGLTTPAPQVQAALNQGQNLPQAVAAQGQVAPEATVQGQLQNLMNFQAGETPAWAKGSVALAQDVLAARGLGSSSIAAGTIVQALQNAALPIAQWRDAASWAFMSSENAANRSFNLAVAANNRQYAEDVYQRDRKTTMASAAAAIFTDVFMPSFGAT